jgi:phage shock protein PspC (stress-responsive transcriptional regulator)
MKKSVRLVSIILAAIMVFGVVFYIIAAMAG